MGLTTTFCLLSLLQVAGTLPLYSRKGRAVGFAKGTDENEYESLGDVDTRTEDPESSPHRLRQIVWVGAHGMLRYDKSQCIHMSQPWVSGYLDLLSQEISSSFRVRLHTASSGASRSAFPEQRLFQYIRTIYSCCKLGFTCRKVKGLQGRLQLEEAGKNLEFYLDADILSLSILRVELHLEISNPDHITVTPVLQTSTTRSSSHLKLVRNDISDLALDMTFLFRMLQKSGGMRNEELESTSLTLNCIVSHQLAPCDHYGVSILGAPFIAILYK